MSEETLYCIGCGGPLQNTHPEEAFYTPKTLDAKENLLCQRCFRMRHYGIHAPSFFDEQAMRKTLDQVAARPGALVWVMDAFDFEGTLPGSLIKLSQSKPTLIVLNKRDLLPKVLNDQKLLFHLKKRFKDYGVHYQDIVFVSAKKRQNIDALLDRLETFEPTLDLYLMGATNVGKSSLLNAMLRATGVPKDVVTTSKQEATTQSLIPIPFDERTLYDTPGLLLDHSIQRFLAANEAYVLMSEREIKGRVYQLNPEQTLFFGGLIQLDFLAGERASVVVYLPQSLTIHRRKLEGSDDFFKQHLGTLLTPPSGAQLTYDHTRFTLNPSLKQDLVLPGLGFVTLKGAKSIQVRHPKSMRVFVKEAMI